MTDRSDLSVVLGLLDLDERAEDVFVGVHPDRVGPRTFGGQLLAQALVAAGNTVGDRPVHALTMHFIRGGDVREPLEFRVERQRDGRDFANRMVTVTQAGATVAVMLVAFQRPGVGLEHSVEIPEVPFPEALPPLGDRLSGYESHLKYFVDALKPVDLRFANDPAWILREDGRRLDHNRVWLRADGAMPDDALRHAALLAYTSDTTLLDSVLTTHGLSWGFDRVVAATVNHSMWFHRPVRLDEWTLYASESPVAAGQRGLATGRCFSLDGELVATVAQEALVRHFPQARP